MINPDLKFGDTEIKILDAARKVFIRKGMDGARMQEIADEAQINKSLLHYYFRNKEKLFEAVFSSIFKSIFPKINEILKSERSYDFKITQFVEIYTDMLLENPYLPIFIIQEINRDFARMQSFLDHAAPFAVAFMTQIQAEMKNHTLKPVDPRVVVINMLSMIIFPIIAMPMFGRVMCQGDMDAYKQLILTQKKNIPDLIYTWLRTNTVE